MLAQVINSATPCATAWAEVGLSALRPSLHEQAVSIAEHQETSIESRKALAARAKSFKAAVEAELEPTSELHTAGQALVRSRNTFWLSLLLFLLLLRLFSF